MTTPQARDQRATTMVQDPRRSLLLAAVLGAMAALLFVLVWSTATRDVLQHVDDPFRDLMVDLRWTPAVQLAKALAFLSGAVCNWAVRVVVVVLLVRRRQWLHLTAFALAVATTEALIGPLKALYDRPRPPGSLIATSGASFPSGHAISAAVTAVGLVIVLLPPGHTRWRWERWAVLWAAVIALTRTYLGAHWLSDVVAGGLLGGAVALGWPALLVSWRDARAARAVPSSR